MPMREECKHFESRTYADGETARKCQLDLAPEAPWRCPADCASYERRLADVNWNHGNLIEPPIEDEPEGEGIAELLDEAEDIVNAAGTDIVAEVEAQDGRQQGSDGGFGGKVRGWFRRKG